MTDKEILNKFKLLEDMDDYLIVYMDKEAQQSTSMEANSIIEVIGEFYRIKGYKEIIEIKVM